MPEKNTLENDFFGVLNDLFSHLPDLTLVGGWVPYVYANFLWRLPEAKPVFTTDVDMGIGLSHRCGGKKTVFETLSGLDYSERHIKIGKLQPIVFYRKNKTRLDFIAPAETDDSALGNILGKEIAVNRLKDFAFLLNNTMNITFKRGRRNYNLHCPRPGAFALHKCATFTDRDDRQKMGKDLYYAYFVLRYAPVKEELLAEIRNYREEEIFGRAIDNIKVYFTSETSPGCAMVEKENGPDDYIDNLPEDIYRRFTALL